MHSHFLPPSINGREHEFDEILPEMFLIYAASIKAITTLFHCTSIGQDDETILGSIGRTVSRCF
jgi:hypothetical protein